MPSAWGVLQQVRFRASMFILFLNGTELVEEGV